ncbi:hypothetical protein MHM88_21310 [Epibacterium sp. MM17-32]|uniref:hypothetical protein n=1 Tax=Epibacterium sp. MM17-32 TaxID=2917734 RepID=UPI001EF678CA|nr:hypothetical protein [Epibacterium sp. MM17-32]MCG7630349.1 hypothetical protein [Epibacterium sp. MM17-32]
MVEFGKKIYPPKKGATVEKTDTSIKGPHWSITLIDGKYVYEYVSGSHGGGIKRHVVSKEDFEAVHADRMTDYDLALKYDLS